MVAQDVADALQSGQLGWYLADVMEQEPPRADEPLLTAPPLRAYAPRGLGTPGGASALDGHCL